MFFTVGQRVCQLLWTTEVWEWTERSVWSSRTSSTERGYGERLRHSLCIQDDNTVGYSHIKLIHDRHCSVKTAHCWVTVCNVCVRWVLYVSSSLQRKAMILRVMQRDTSSKQVCFSFFFLQKFLKWELFFAESEVFLQNSVMICSSIYFWKLAEIHYPCLAKTLWFCNVSVCCSSEFMTHFINQVLVYEMWLN